MFSVVVATCRNPQGATELRELAKQYPNLVISKLDVLDESTIKVCFTNLQSIKLTLGW
jgi:enoyl-[acyl-carrier-protein] reductase (NADH)